MRCCCRIGCIDVVQPLDWLKLMGGVKWMMGDDGGCDELYIARCGPKFRRKSKPNIVAPPTSTPSSDDGARPLGFVRVRSCYLVLLVRLGDWVTLVSIGASGSSKKASYHRDRTRVGFRYQLVRTYAYYLTWA